MRTSLPRLTVRVAVGALSVLGLTACARSETTTTKASPSHVETIEGSTVKRLILEPKAVERLDLKTDKVRAATPQDMEGITPAGQSGRTAVAFDAVLYDNKGATFVFTNPKPLEYVRQAITVEGIKNRVAVLTVGPPADTTIVTVGVVLLYGAETGVGK